MGPTPTSKTPPHFLDGKTILVSGAGIAGLAFAVAFAQHFSDIPSDTRPKLIVFERDSHEERIGREGYTLALRAEDNAGGVQVLDRLGLYERVRSVSVHGQASANEGGCFNVWDTQFHPIVSLKPAPAGPKGLLGMRIRRNTLQKVLATAAIESGVDIHWESNIIDASPDEAGGVKVHLLDGSIVLGDILVAADGSRSALRSLLEAGHNLEYAGVHCWSGIAKYASREQVPEPINRDWGLVVGAKDAIGLFVSPVDQTSALWSFSCRHPQQIQPLRHPVPKEQFENLMKTSMDMAENFSPMIKNMICATDPSTVMLFNAMDRQPFPHRSLQSISVVFIGDANHAVSPFAGAGANLALMDAWDLAAGLKNASNLAEAIMAYDKLAVPRASRILQMSRWTIDAVHATGIKLSLYKLVLQVLGYLVRRLSRA